MTIIQSKPQTQHSHSFTCDDREGRAMEMLMIFSEQEHQLTISCTFDYHKYLFREENSSIIHFKYYKSCLPGNVACSVEENITLLMNDNSDIHQTTKLVLEKQERKHDEKLDIMFDVMMNEILELKEKLWFTDRKLNKFAEKYISNWEQLFKYQWRQPNHMVITKTMNPPLNPSHCVDITGLTNGSTIFKQPYNQYQFKEEALEPIIIYFKYPVEFSGVEFSVDIQKNDEEFDLKVFVYGVMKPNGIIRNKGTMTETEFRNNFGSCSNTYEQYFIMPSLTLLKENESQEKTVSVTFQSQKPYDGIGIAVRLKKMVAENGNICKRYQYSNYQLSNVKIF